MLSVNGDNWGLVADRVRLSEFKLRPFYECFRIVVDAWNPLELTGLPLYYEVTHTFEILPEPAE